MRWLKHLSMAHADQQVVLLLEEHGPEPYGAWWLIIEHIAAPMEKDRMTPEATHSEQSWAGIIHVSRKNVRRIFQILEKSGLITTSTIDGRIRIEVRNIHKDEYSKKSGQTPANSPETPPTQTERDREQIESRAEREPTPTASPRSGEAHGSRLTLADPTAEMTSFATDEMHWEETKIRSVWATFADYWRAQPGAKGRKSDWLATWRNWCRRERQNLPGPSNGVVRFPAKADFVSDVTEVMQRRVARGETPL